MKEPKNSDLSGKVKDLKEKLTQVQNKNSITTAILEGGTLIIWAVDRSNNLISFNQNYFNHFMSGMAESEIGVLENDGLKFYPEKVFWPKKYVEALAGQSLNFEIKFESKGIFYWKEVFLNPIYESTGEVSGVSGLAYDITEKMKSKLALVESERMFRNIFESFQDLYFRCNFKGEIVMLSPSVFDISGYRENELLGKNITNYYLYKAKTKSLLRSLAADTRVRNFEVDLVHKSGDIIPCICNVRLVYNDQNKPIYIEGVARDITELKETNKQLIEAKELAEVSLKIKERFLANMSHEIRTPLNGIIGMIHLLDKPDLNQEQKKHVKSLRNSSEILLNILNDLLDLSKIEAGKMTIHNQPVEVEEMLDKIHSLYHEQARSNKINLTIEKDPKIPAFIFSDQTKIIQVFSNLISNAIKFTPKGGNIEVRLKLIEKENTGWLKLMGEVKDNGIGIAEKDQRQLFKSFTQVDSSVKKAFKGTGLGLYISKEIVSMFNGDINVTSALQQGSIFQFTFESSLTRIRPEEEENLKIKLEGKPKILVVDDNQINLELAAAILKNANCEVILCQGGASCIKTIQDDGATFDAILMDIQMPDMDGIATTKNIKSLLGVSAPPVIAMTAYSMRGDEEKFLNLGFDDYISKPIKPKILIEKLEKWSKKSLMKDTPTPIETEEQQLNSIDSSVIAKLEEFGGKEVVKEALSEFDSECDHQISDMKIHFKHKDYKEVLNILHTLKGNAGTLGVTEMAKTAEYFENELKQKKYHIFDDAISKLEDLHYGFKADLKSLLNKND